MHPTQLERDRRYAATPKGQYARHKANAVKRGVPFQLTFEEWQAIWKHSGKWELRGNTSGCYVMARHGDKGPYALGNVSIQPFSKNLKDARKKAAQMTRRHTARTTTVTFA